MKKTDIKRKKTDFFDNSNCFSPNE